jgi:hypothetical protein
MRNKKVACTRDYLDKARHGTWVWAFLKAMNFRILQVAENKEKFMVEAAGGCEFSPPSRKVAIEIV